MGILASISLPRKMLLAVVMLAVGVSVMALSLSSSKGKLSPISYPGQDAQKPFAKLMMSQMVPGNPLYLLLMVRDRVELTLTVDPVQKAWKRVELSDQRLQTSRTLFADGEVDLGLSTLNKAEQYLGTATEELQQHDASDLAKLETTLIEHQQMMTALKTNLNDADKSRLDQILSFNASLIQTISPR